MADYTTCPPGTYRCEVVCHTFKQFSVDPLFCVTLRPVEKLNEETSQYEPYWLEDKGGKWKQQPTMVVTCNVQQEWKLRKTMEALGNPEWAALCADALDEEGNGRESDLLAGKEIVAICTHKESGDGTKKNEYWGLPSTNGGAAKKLTPQSMERLRQMLLPIHSEELPTESVSSDAVADTPTPYTASGDDVLPFDTDDLTPF